MCPVFVCLNIAGEFLYWLPSGLQDYTDLPRHEDPESTSGSHSACLQSWNAIIYMLNCVYTNLDLPAGTVRVVFFTFPVHSIPSGQPSRVISWQRGKWMPLSCPGLLITWQEDDNMCVFNIVYKKDISYTAVPQRGILIRSYSPSTPWISAKDLLSSEVFRCLWWLDASVRVIRWSTGLWWTPLSEARVESSSQSDKEQAHTEKK